MGGQVISINDVNYSSVVRSEKSEDTIITMNNFADIIVLRTKEAGEALRALKVSKVPLIINAGDGNGDTITTNIVRFIYDIQTLWSYRRFNSYFCR